MHAFLLALFVVIAFMVGMAVRLGKATARNYIDSVAREQARLDRLRQMTRGIEDEDDDSCGGNAGNDKRKRD